MGKFIFKILIFSVPLLMALAALEYIARMAPNSYRYKNEYINQNYDSINSLILGSSHTFYGINPQFLENNSFNLANVSQDLMFDLYLLNRYIDKYTNLKTIIVPISYFTIYDAPLNRGSEQFRVKFYELYMGYNNSLLNCLENKELYDIAIFQEKIKNYFLWVLNLKTDFGYNSLGWATGYKESKIDNSVEDDAVKTIARHTYYDDAYVDCNSEYLEQIAKLCYNRNVKLYFITTPTLPAYYNRIDDSRWNLSRLLVNNICLKYNASYYNYLCDERFDNSDFFDVDHLCHKGAEKFSKILKNELFK